MYLTEAEKEDKEITEAWKGEADSILVFVSENALSYILHLHRQLKALIEDRSILCYCRGLHHRKLQEPIS
jgi:hypothetical protein